MNHYNHVMPEILLILETSITNAGREAILRVVSPTQSISNRVFLASLSESAVDQIRTMAGVSRVLTGGEVGQNLPHLTDAESIFVEAWLSSRGQVKQRLGDGLDWDTPPMIPPDPKP